MSETQEPKQTTPKPLLQLQFVCTSRTDAPSHKRQRANFHTHRVNPCGTGSSLAFITTHGDGDDDDRNGTEESKANSKHRHANDNTPTPTNVPPRHGIPFSLHMICGTVKEIARNW